MLREKLVFRLNVIRVLVRFCISTIGCVHQFSFLGGIKEINFELVFIDINIITRLKFKIAYRFYCMFFPRAPHLYGR